MIPSKKKRPPASCNYSVEGTLCRKKGRNYFSSPHLGHLCRDGTLPKLRFQAKTAVSNYLKRHLKDPRVASFFSSLATGDLDERALSLEFGKIGVNHLLAISGFHFALLAAFCGFLLRLFLSP